MNEVKINSSCETPKYIHYCYKFEALESVCFNISQCLILDLDVA